MSLSPTSSTVVGIGETSPTSTPQVSTSPPPLDATPSTELRITSSPSSVSPNKVKSKMEEDMASESPSRDISPKSNPIKASDSNDQLGSFNGEHEVPKLCSSPPYALASEPMEAVNCKSPNASRMASSTSPLPATTSPVPKTCTPVSTKTQQQLITSLGASPALQTATTLNTSTICIQSITTDDLEDVMIELNSFDRQQIKDGKENVPTTIPPILEGYLQFVARGGSTHFPWTTVKGLFKVKLSHAISDFYAESPTDHIPAVSNVEAFDFANVKEKLFQKFETFSGIPFTVQRLAELLTYPKRHYRRTDKFLRALEKNMLIVSTVEASVAPPVPDQLSPFPPPHHLPASLHSTTKSSNMMIFTNGQPDMDVYNLKENEPNRPSSRLQEQLSSHGAENGLITASIGSNTSPNRSLTALAKMNENNSSSMSVSSNQCSNVALGVWNRGSAYERVDKLTVPSKEGAKSTNPDIEYEDEDEEEEEEEDDDGEDMELNVGTPGDRNDSGSIPIQSTPTCSSDHLMGRKNFDNTQFSVPSSIERNEDMDEGQSSDCNDSEAAAGVKPERTDASSTVVNEDREIQKRKLATLAADDGTPNKVFVCEKQSMREAQSNFLGTSKVSSVSEDTNNDVQAKKSLKESATNALSSSGSASAVGMVISPGVPSSASDCPESIGIPKSAYSISKNISVKGCTSDPILTKEVPRIINECDVMRSTNVTSNLQSNEVLEDVQEGSDKSIMKGIDKTAMNIDPNEVRDTEVSTLDNKNTMSGDSEIDSSISKSVVLSSGDDNILSEKNTKEDSMEVDTECTASESHIRTSSSII